jgi:hypothetical protein
MLIRTSLPPPHRSRQESNPQPQTNTTKMHHHCKTIGALAAASALVAGNAQAGTPTTTPAPVSPPASAIEFKLHTGYSSEYLWRGLDLGDDLIEAGLDVSATWNGIGLSAGAWYASFQNSDVNVDELDLYAEVSKDFGFVKGSVGYIAYLYPNSNSPTYQEVYFGLSRDLGFATASLKYYWDVEGDNDGYSEFGLSRSFELTSCLSLNLESNIGYLVEHGVATAWTNKVSLDWGFVEHAKLSPFVALAISCTNDEYTSYWNSGNELVGGCMLSVTF